MSDLSNYRQTFLGHCTGVGLSERGLNDLHVCITILHEDDENWFPSEGSLSSFWIDDLQSQLVIARAWMELNCDKDPEGWGWTFRGPS